MKFIPYDYQKYCIEYIKTHPVAALFLTMGLGKTVITLTAIRDLILEQKTVSRVLVIAPLRVARDTWPAEVAKWDHLKDLNVSLAVGSEKKRIQAIERDAMVYVINRENVKSLVRYYEKRHLQWPFDMVVIDELSSFKNAKSQRYRYLEDVRPYVKQWVGLTGTPSSNGLTDLWAEIGILDGGKRLGTSIYQFYRWYYKPTLINPFTGAVYEYTPRNGAEAEIYRDISDITISMDALDYLDMPDCVYVNHDVQMSAAERKLYNQMREELSVSIKDKNINAANAATLSNKLLQMANGAVYDDQHEPQLLHQRKLEMLEDLIESANGQNVLVAYWFRHDRDRIIGYLRRKGYSPRDIRQSKDIQDWNDGEIQVGLIHPASAGHGLNIQKGGHILIWFGLTWSLELYQQTNARLWRQGQEEIVTIHHIICRDTVDEDVMAALEAKDITQERLISAVKAKLCA